MSPQRFGAARKKKARRVFVIGEDQDQRAGVGEIRLADAADDVEEFSDATDPAAYPVEATSLSLNDSSDGALIDRLNHQILGSELLSELT